VWIFGSTSRSDTGPSGDGLALRPPSINDFEEWRNLRAESEKFLVPWEPTWPRDDLTRHGYRRRLRYYKSDAERGYALTWFIIRQSDGNLLGGMTIANIRRGAAQSAQLGYWMGERYAGQGYMKRAVVLCLDHLFNRMGLERIEAACVPRNKRSAGLLKSCGFVREGCLRAYLEINGVREDHHLYAIVKSEFQLGAAGKMTKTRLRTALAADARGGET
jgi:[ribosomal protein S5]-alanine N-acetyltransferase